MRVNANDCTFGNQELLIRYYTEMAIDDVSKNYDIPKGIVKKFGTKSTLKVVQ